MDDRERELTEAVDDLVDTLEALRTELREPRGPAGALRPPTPGEILWFTEGYAIPALIAILESSVRTLKLLAAAIRLAGDRPHEGEIDRRSGPGDLDGLAASSRRTLGRLDEVLAELQSAAVGDPGDATAGPELRRLFEEARELRREVDERLAEPRPEDDPEPTDIEVRSGDEAEGDGADDSDEGVGIDVERELDSIKRELDEDEETDEGDEEGDRDTPGAPDSG